MLFDQGQDSLQEHSGRCGKGSTVAVAVQPQELLLRVRENAGLGDRRHVNDFVQRRVFYTLDTERLTQLCSLVVGPYQSRERHIRAQARQGCSYVAGPTRGVDFPHKAHDRNRCLRRDPSHMAVDVTVEHHVADDEHRDLECRVPK